MVALKPYLPICLLVAFTLLVFNTISFSLDEHIVGLWLFDDGSGKKASDSSNYGNHGVVEGGAEWVDGKFKGGLSFNGADAYVEVPSSGSLEIGEKITIEFWFYPRSFSGELDIVRKHQLNGDTYNYEIYVNGSGILSPNINGVIDPFQTVTLGGAEVPFDEWTHLAFTYDGEKVLLYVNGEQEFEQAVSGKIPTASDPLYIGCRDGTRRFIDGIMDELCISDISRSADEIKAHIEKGIANVVAVEEVGKLTVTWAALKKN